MLEFLVQTIIWTLALYGFFEIIKNIIYMCTYTKLKCNGTYLIIVTKNQEQNIENLLRTISFKIIYGKEEKLKEIFIADLNSTDKTPEIIRKICNDNKNLKYVTWKECKNIIDNIDYY